MLKIYNSYTNQLEEFKPIIPGHVSMYVCGPTVYNYIHIGNARPLVFFDVVFRYFKLKGYQTMFISNFTDIDDKIIKKALEMGVSEEEVANKFIDAYLDDAKQLNCLNVDVRCKVTDYIDEIIKFINKLIELGFAYKSGSDVYFSVSKLEEYGKLSNQIIDELIVGSRVDASTLKLNQADFTLWKETSEGITFPSNFGDGRPGWHTECVVMIKSIVDKMVDIHGGGHDLIFPHHENEVAQSMAYDNSKLANYWIHNGMININDDKMSKSLGNVVLVKDLIKKYGGNVLRICLLQTHYRQTVNFTSDLVESSIKINDRIQNVFKMLKLNIAISKEVIISSENKFLEIFEEDLNTANLFTYLFDLVKKINADVRNSESIVKYYDDFMNLLYLLGLEYNYPELTNIDVEKYLKWEKLRKQKEFEAADELRDYLVTRGVI